MNEVNGHCAKMHSTLENFLYVPVVMEGGPSPLHQARQQICVTVTSLPIQQNTRLISIQVPWPWNYKLIFKLRFNEWIKLVSALTYT